MCNLCIWDNLDYPSMKKYREKKKVKLLHDNGGKSEYLLRRRRKISESLRKERKSRDCLMIKIKGIKIKEIKYILYKSAFYFWIKEILFVLCPPRGEAAGRLV